MSVIYNEEAVSKGGRNGHVAVKNTPLSFEMVAEGGCNPEQLFAAAYASCWANALIAIIKMKGIELSQPEVSVSVRLCSSEEKGPYLEANIVAYIQGADQELANKLVEQTHALCPYSRAMKGNIDINVTAQV